MWFTRVSIANPVFATMMMAALLVLGAFSYSRLPVEQFPDVTFPVVVVQTEYPGASPENVEEEVTRRLEESVNTISGIKTLSSRSYEGLSVVIIEFDLSVDAKLAAQDVREKIALIRSTFRDEIKEPRVSRFNPDDFPIVSVSVQSSGRSLREPTTLADQVIKKRLENVGGVGQATLVGGVKRDYTAEHLDQVLKTVDILEERTRYYIQVATEEETLRQRLAGVGRISHEDAVLLGAVLALDTPVLAFTLFLSLATGLLFGMLPAFGSVSQFSGASFTAGGARGAEGQIVGNHVSDEGQVAAIVQDAAAGDRAAV